MTKVQISMASGEDITIEDVVDVQYKWPHSFVSSNGDQAYQDTAFLFVTTSSAEHHVAVSEIEYWTKTEEPAATVRQLQWLEHE